MVLKKKDNALALMGLKQKSLHTYAEGSRPWLPKSIHLVKSIDGIIPLLQGTRGLLK